MVLLIIADDFTGALDTGVQFAALGIRTRVVVGSDIEFSTVNTDILVVDSETRHLKKDEAYLKISVLVRKASDASIPYLYKKTDSALRGNIGSELEAMLKTSGSERLAFLPAFPQMDRITRNGIHYISGVPVNESPFGKDPFDPVREADVKKLIALQSTVPAYSMKPLQMEDDMPEEKGILVFDSQCVDELFSTGKVLIEKGKTSVLAGCAGFAGVLPSLLNLKVSERRDTPSLDSRLLVVCGSVNTITVQQLDNAEGNGFTRLRLTPEEKLTESYWSSEKGRKKLISIEEMLKKNPHCVIDTNDSGGNNQTLSYSSSLGLGIEEVRLRIAQGVGELVSTLIFSPNVGTLLLTGGDILLECMKRIGVNELEPISEIEKGVVLTRLKHCSLDKYVITKSGGFGKTDLLSHLAGKLLE